MTKKTKKCACGATIWKEGRYYVSVLGRDCHVHDEGHRPT